MRAVASSFGQMRAVASSFGQMRAVASSFGDAGDAVVERVVASADEELGRLVGVDVLVQVLAPRHLARLGALHGGIHFLAYLRFDRLDLCGRCQVQLKQVALGTLDRIACFAHTGDLVAVAVSDPWVGHGMAMVTICVHLHHDGPLLECVCLGEARRLPYVETIHPVHLNPWHCVAARVVVQSGCKLILINFFDCWST